MENNLNLFSLTGFNDSIKYIKIANIISKFLTAGCNFSDIINILSGKIKNEHILYFLKIFLVDKFQYQYYSFNLKKDFSEVSMIPDLIGQCNLINTNIVYHDIVLGISCFNPQNSNHWQNVELNKDNLISIYANTKPAIKPLLKDYFKNIDLFFSGFVTKISFDEQLSGEYPIVKSVAAAKKAMEIAKKNREAEKEDKQVKATQVAGNQVAGNQVAGDQVGKTQNASVTTTVHKSSKKKKTTPKYSIQITNELFHNGNVEAWKNIIESYNVAYPDIELLIFFQGSKVTNVNSLFKWGKVKNGDVILFCLIGEEFKSISKLQRYLFEGASNRFERYLKKDINKTLNLFS